MKKETWKNVVGYEGIYAVSNFGQVKRLTNASGTQAGKILNGTVGSHGYLVVRLRKNGVAETLLVHRLVVTAFIGKPQVNHKDGNKTNNNLENLEYVDRSGNGLHSYHLLKNRNLDNCRHGKRTYGTSVLTDEIVQHIRSLAKEGKSSTEINKVYPVVKRAQIRNVITRRAWAHVE